MTGPLYQCSECGYVTPYQGTSCPLCEGTKWQLAEPVAQRVVDYNPRSFSLSTLFLIMTLICVSFGGLMVAPGLTIPLIVIAIPALLRTWAQGASVQSRGRRWPLQDKIAVFYESAAIVFLILVGSVIAFFVACFTGCWAGVVVNKVSEAIGIHQYTDLDWMYIFGFGLGGIAAVGMFGYLMWKYWPRPK